MSPVHLAHPNLLYLLWSAPLLLLAVFVAGRIRRRDLRRFSLRPTGLEDAEIVRRRRASLLLLSVLFLVAAAVGFGVDPHSTVVKRQGREVVFLVDVSRSMLARDLAPSRLGRAKQSILDALPAMTGDRVGLVAFAGSASVICPLTFDRTFFGESVRRLSTNSASEGGSMIGDAIRYTLKRVFSGDRHSYKDIILISDGGDNGSFPVKAASEAGSAGVRILSIGLGNQKSGTRIPTSPGARRYVTYRSHVVRSALDAALMRKIAEATPGGRFLDVGTGSFDLAPIFRAFEREAPTSSLGSRRVTSYRPVFQLFLALSLVSLIGELLLGLRLARRVSV